MIEKDFQNAVVDLAHTFGWRVAHFRTSMNARGHYQTAVGYDGKGFPDCVFVHPRRQVLFVEFKTDTGRLSDEQEAWGDWLDDAGADYCLWRPGNSDIIAGVLSFGRITEWFV